MTYEGAAAQVRVAACDQSKEDKRPVVSMRVSALMWGERGEVEGAEVTRGVLLSSR